MKKRALQRSQQRVLSALGQFIKDNPDAKIRDVLDQEELLDSKQNGRLFGEYVTQTPERFWEMLQIINIKEDEDLENIPKKYPFIISEIIGSKEELIIDYFFSLRGLEEFEFLNFLFKTIDRDYIDNTLAGYFGKIIKAIIDRRGIDFWKYLIYPQKESQNALEDFIKHLDVHHIADILFNLIRFDTIRQENGDLFLEQRIHLLHRIIYYMQQKNYDNLVVENVCYILKNILTNTNEIEEKEIFIQNIMQSQLQYNSFLISKSSDLVDLLIELLNNTQQDHKPIQNRIIYNYSLLQEVSYYLANLLDSEQNLSQFLTTYGIIQEPLGQFKLKLIEFYLKVIKHNNLNIINYFQHQNVCFAIMQLIRKHEFNNQIQNLFLEIIQLVMKNQEYIDIKQAYIQVNIFGFLEELNSQDRYQVGKIKKIITKGFQGMANMLSYQLKDDFQEEKWQIYINRQQQIFQNENSYLLGQNPNCTNENEEINNEILQSLTLGSDQNIVRESSNQKLEQNQKNQQKQELKPDIQSDKEQIIKQPNNDRNQNIVNSGITYDHHTNFDKEQFRSDQIKKDKPQDIQNDQRELNQDSIIDPKNRDKDESILNIQQKKINDFNSEQIDSQLNIQFQQMSIMGSSSNKNNIEVVQERKLQNFIQKNESIQFETLSKPEVNQFEFEDKQQ